jgi:hypothetical protein
MKGNPGPARRDTNPCPDDSAASIQLSLKDLRFFADWLNMVLGKEDNAKSAKVGVLNSGSRSGDGSSTGCAAPGLVCELLL